MRGKRRGQYSPGRSNDSGGDDSTRWLGTYGDAITLLMAFFVMLYAMSEVDAQKFEAFIRGLAPFGNQAAAAAPAGPFEGGPSIVGEAGDLEAGNVTADLRVETGLPTPAADPMDPDAGASELPPTDDIEQLEGVQDAIMSSLADAGLEDLADFRFDGRGLVLSLATDNVLFASGSTEISDLGRQLVAAVAEPLQEFGNDVFVEGHTDDVPLDRGGYTNWNLSTDRAVAVVNLLASEHALEQTRLGAAGYAEHRPRVPNDGPENRAKNRRVDILIVAQGVIADG